ncbi:MAG TPA: CAP domain-containing protein, partial [Spirochaetia bacterium]|nr:CAP domain-containing protein [Spirochaetia bacterium]
MICLLSVWVLTAGIAFSEGFSVIDTVSEEEFTEYKALNEAEERLGEYKDSDEALRYKLLMLSYINRSRDRYKAQPLALDILASRVANKQSKEAAEKGFSGHWNTAGEKPYHRYAFAGGVDHVAENAASYWSSVAIDPATVLDLMHQCHDRFMAEQAPNDGHKKNVIEKRHTHVGLGFYLTGSNFRYYEE